jgi:hypothetical protein
MKKAVLVLALFALMAIDSEGQWYNKKYGVSDINGLTEEQLSTSFQESGNNLLIAAVVAGCGGLLIWAGKSTIKNGLDEDATAIEQLFGAEFMGKTYIVLGVGAIAGGTVTALVLFGRHERIRSVLHRNYGPAASLSISPSVITTGFMQSPAVGMTVRVNF